MFLTDLYVARAFFLITTEVVALAGLLAFLLPVVARTIPPSALAETATSEMIYKYQGYVDSQKGLTSWVDKGVVFE